jgi:hypothetical protein
LIFGDSTMPVPAAAAAPGPVGIMAADPGALFETVAKEHGATVRAVVEALPESSRGQQRWVGVGAVCQGYDAAMVQQ